MAATCRDYRGGLREAERYASRVLDTELLQLMRHAAAAAGEAIQGQQGRGFSGERATQYFLDLTADKAAVDVLVAGGLRVLSEESGTTGTGPLVCVLDPIDGSTNCDRGIPFFSTSACVLDDDGMRCAVVVNHATGTRYEAVRGQGATRDGFPIRASSVREISEAIIGFSGLPATYGGWAQFRALGSASLEICAVADGSLDGYTVAAYSRLSPWDYLGGMLVALEAGATVIDLDGAELVEASDARRRPLATGTPELADELRAFCLSPDG
jgi:fructose-1,6-bisphosphatase/inositol monophosphatase family enzyme